MSIYRLDDTSFDFPSPEEADDEYDGLLAVGGDYNPERLLNAYSKGIFPWPVAEGRPITWFSPDPRFILKAEDFRIPKSLKKTLKKGLFDYRVDTAFAEVIHECSIVPRPGQDGTWITGELEKGLPWIDCQIYTDHLARFGAKDIPRVEYLRLLREALVNY
jgi:leucyl/phenylalanyl-tRNA--protein transferase